MEAGSFEAARQREARIRGRRKIRTVWRGLGLAPAILGLLSLAPPVIGAQPSAVSPTGLPAFEVRPEELKPGTWVRYSVINRRTGQAVLFRLAALERLGPAQWFEVSVTDQWRRTIVFKMLLEGDLNAPKRVRQAIVQPPGQAPLIIPRKAMGGQWPRFTSGRYGKKADTKTRKRVKVAAGTFMATHYRSKDASGKPEEAWVSDDVRGWPLVKARSGDLEVELAGWGRSARSEIRGQPLPIDEKLFQQLRGAGPSVPSRPSAPEPDAPAKDAPGPPDSSPSKKR